MPSVYVVKQWNERYENNRSRKVKDLQWVPVPNSHDGEGYTRVMAHPMAAQIFAAWILILEVASKSQRRGYLERDNGKAHTAESLALKTRASAEWFQVALDFLSSDDVGWMVLEEERQGDVTTTSPDCHPGDEEGNGREKKEEKEEKESAELASALLDHLCEIPACKSYLEVGEQKSKALSHLREFIRDNPGYPPGWWLDWVKDLKARLPAAQAWKFGEEFRRAVAPVTVLRGEWRFRPAVDVGSEALGVWVPDTDWLPVGDGVYRHVSTGEERLSPSRLKGI